jgi:hypothetical protein
VATLLIATTSGSVVERIDLDPARAYSIGRSHRCDIPLTPRSVSRRHAVLFPHAAGWWVADAGSCRGLATSAGPTRFAQLTTDRWVALGPLVLWLLPTRSRPTAARLSAPLALAGAEEGRSAAPQDDLHDDEPDACDASGEHRAQLPHLFQFESSRTAPNGAASARFIDLSALPFATVGSDIACTIRLQGEAIAPLHAVLVREPSHWALVAAQGIITAEGARFRRKRLESAAFVGLGDWRLRAVEVERPVVMPAVEGDEGAREGQRNADSSAFLRSDSAA